ncbi:MAG: hypothetical protein D6790_11845 [Caldilineae bacterium]|nr:MAG: hypothetical protein D6790_11845 [Caldilineae bacterium]
MARLLVINLFISLLWPTLTGNYDLRALFLGFGLGFVILTFVQPHYGRFILGLITFTAYVAFAILQSNLRLAWLVLRVLVSSNVQLRPGIVGVPLRIRDPFEITVLASVITLTPGTLSVDLGADAAGAPVLYVHTIDLSTPHAFRHQIQNSFEERILALRRHLDAMNAPSGPENSPAGDAL